MIRFALRRVLWLVPTLLIITVLAFWVLSSAIEHPTDADLPRFFNPRPRDLRALALDAARQVSESEQSRKSEVELGRLGAAALPHVLPLLDSMSPAGRARVALALSPVATRMGIADRAELKSPQAAVLFWQRYWQDHAVDFRPAVVKRTVRRFAERPSALRRQELIEFDTYALRDTLEQLASAARNRDVDAVRRLSAVSAHITAQPWLLADGASAEDAARLTERWQRWWGESRHRFVDFTGIRRIEAMFRETRYGRWATDVARGGLGRLPDGQPVLRALEERARTTLGLLLIGLLLGYPLGLFLGTAAALREGLPDALSAAAALVVIAVPSALLSVWVGRFAGSWAAGALVAIVTALLVSRHHTAAQKRLHREDFIRTARAFGSARSRVAFKTWRASAMVSAALLCADLPALITTAFVVEQAFALPGIGPATVAAVNAGNTAWLMVIAVLSALSVGLAQIAGDVALRACDPRTASPTRRGSVE